MKHKLEIYQVGLQSQWIGCSRMDLLLRSNYTMYSSSI